MMKLKHLESALSGAEVFQRPKIELEQIPTSAHIAACMIHTSSQNGDIEDRVVGDFGVGTGILVSLWCNSDVQYICYMLLKIWCQSMASSLMGSYYGIGVDVDQDALTIAQRNFDVFDIGNVDLVYSDVQTLAVHSGKYCLY